MIFTICRRTTASPYHILKSLFSKLDRPGNVPNDPVRSLLKIGEMVFLKEFAFVKKDSFFLFVADLLLFCFV